MCIIIARATTKDIQRDIMKNSLENLNGILKNIQITQNKAGKGK